MEHIYWHGQSTTFSQNIIRLLMSLLFVKFSKWISCDAIGKSVLVSKIMTMKLQHQWIIEMWFILYFYFFFPSFKCDMTHFVFITLLCAIIIFCIVGYCFRRFFFCREEKVFFFFFLVWDSKMRALAGRTTCKSSKIKKKIIKFRT